MCKRTEKGAPFKDLIYEHEVGDSTIACMLHTCTWDYGETKPPAPAFNSLRGPIHALRKSYINDQISTTNFTPNPVSEARENSHEQGDVLRWEWSELT